MSEWTTTSDDELTDDERSALDAAVHAVTEWGAGTATLSGRNTSGEMLWSATVAQIDGRMVGFVTRHGFDDERLRARLDVVVATTGTLTELELT